jgi:hypothetical protein
MIGITLVSDLYSYNLTVVLDFLTYQDKHHIKVCTVSVEIIFIRTCCETGQNNLTIGLFFYQSLMLVHLYFIYDHNIYIFKHIYSSLYLIKQPYGNK